MEKYLPLINEDEEGFERSQLAWKRKSRRCYQIRLSTAILSLILVISLSCNLFFILPLQNSANPETSSISPQGTRWAGLVRNVSVPIYSSTEYGPAVGTQEERDALWGALDISPGTIALSDEFAAQNGLPRSQRFPWDQSKGIYIIGAFHQMHCLIKIQKFTSAAHRGAPLEDDNLYHHVEHCLDGLLQDVYCHADDTPWFELPPKPFRQGYDPFQTRQCRNWDRLVDWAAGYDACYRDDNVTDVNGREVESEYEHYTFCPEGSEYVPEMERYYREHELHRTGFVFGAERDSEE
ncbi:hypothetical protein HO133_011101 [Letharia lupina]|uniref:Uncharacterized protein n=1 Tax=Letharia lupina TaxID=560253 RepID=A0A8H6FE46_9LECA|nr:uncharacterized protein HO133_011101 [Letharia lupina]KAF6224524.1 hypothetical protein HO133_011101 [Letharia lupina]